jgi:hypothetical protein
MHEPGNRDWRGTGSSSGPTDPTPSKASYVVFVFDTKKPLGGWSDVLKEDGKARYFTDERLAARAGKDYAKSVFTKSWRYEVVEVTTGRLMGSGGYNTGRNHTKEAK